MTDDLRDRLADHLTRIESYPLGSVGGKLTICAESMADALLPFVRAEIARELRRFADSWVGDGPLNTAAQARSPWFRTAGDLRSRADELDT